MGEVGRVNMIVKMLVDQIDGSEMDRQETWGENHDLLNVQDIVHHVLNTAMLSTVHHTPAPQRAMQPSSICKEIAILPFQSIMRRH